MEEWSKVGKPGLITHQVNGAKWTQVLSGHKVDEGGGGLYIYMYMDTLSGHKVDEDVGKTRNETKQNKYIYIYMDTLRLESTFCTA